LKIEYQIKRRKAQ